MSTERFQRPLNYEAMAIVPVGFTAFPAVKLKHYDEEAPDPLQRLELVFDKQHIPLLPDTKLEIYAGLERCHLTGRYTALPLNCTLTLSNCELTIKQWETLKKHYAHDGPFRGNRPLTILMAQDEHETQTIGTFRHLTMTMWEQPSKSLILNFTLIGTWHEQVQAIKQWHKENEQFKVS